MSVLLVYLSSIVSPNLSNQINNSSLPHWAANADSGLVFLQTSQDLMQYSKREFSKKWEINATLVITQLGLQAHGHLRLSV